MQNDLMSEPYVLEMDEEVVLESLAAEVFELAR